MLNPESLGGRSSTVDLLIEDNAVLEEPNVAPSSVVGASVGSLWVGRSPSPSSLEQERSFPWV